MAQKREIDALVERALNGALSLVEFRDALEDASWDMFNDGEDPAAAEVIARVVHLFSEQDAGTATDRDVRRLLRELSGRAAASGDVFTSHATVLTSVGRAVPLERRIEAMAPAMDVALFVINARPSRRASVAPMFTVVPTLTAHPEVSRSPHLAHPMSHASTLEAALRA